MQHKMFSKTEYVESEEEEEEPLMKRVIERRQSGYYTRKREKTKLISKSQKEFHGHEVTIPQHIITFEILTRLPVKTLLRFRSVCKDWRNLTFDPQFISLHFEQSKKRPIFLIAPVNLGKLKDISLYRYDNIDENMKNTQKIARLVFKHEFSDVVRGSVRAFHANGLILLSTHANGLVVCNPCTRESIKLPQGQGHYNDIFWLFKNPCRAAMCYVASSKSYKVVQYFHRHYRVGLEVLTLGSNINVDLLTWKVASEDVPYPIYRECPQAVGEYVYFKIANSLHNTTWKSILSYNVVDEKYRVVDLPCQYMIDVGQVNITDLEGDVYFTCMRDESIIDVWIMSSMDLTLHRKLSIELIRFAYFYCPIAVRNGKLLLHLNDGIRRLDYYDPKTDWFENVALIAREVLYYERENCRARIFNQDSSLHVTSFVESLVTIAGSSSTHQPVSFK